MEVSIVTKIVKATATLAIITGHASIDDAQMATILDGVAAICFLASYLLEAWGKYRSSQKNREEEVSRAVERVLKGAGKHAE